MIRLARPAECAALSDLALRSKAYWGYPAEFLAACRHELAVSAGDLDRHPTWVLQGGGVAIGFYSLEPLGDGRVELGHLFVEPGAIGRGHGRRLMRHARAEALRGGWSVLVIQGDPHAAGFYEACGAVRVGSSASASIPGRTLPLFELALDAEQGGA